MKWAVTCEFCYTMVICVDTSLATLGKVRESRMRSHQLMRCHRITSNMGEERISESQPTGLPQSALHLEQGPKWTNDLVEPMQIRWLSLGYEYSLFQLIFSYFWWKFIVWFCLHRHWLTSHTFPTCSVLCSTFTCTPFICFVNFKFHLPTHFARMFVVCLLTVYFKDSQTFSCFLRALCSQGNKRKCGSFTLSSGHL